MVSIDSLSISTVTTTLGELRRWSASSACWARPGGRRRQPGAGRRRQGAQRRAVPHLRATNQTDTLVIDQFVNPPAATALDVLTAETTEDATVKQAILDMQADQAAVDLEAFEAARPTSTC